MSVSVRKTALKFCRADCTCISSDIGIRLSAFWPLASLAATPRFKQIGRAPHVRRTSCCTEGTQLSRAFRPIAAILLLVALALVVGSAKADQTVLATGSADLHSEVTGTGPLANFEARGENLIRLLAGAFDPRSDSLPTVSGMTLRQAATLPAGTAQYWLVQVRDQRFAEVVRAVTARRRSDRRQGAPTTPTWCARPRRSALHRQRAPPCAGRATTSRRGVSRSRPAASPACSTCRASSVPRPRLPRRPGPRGRSVARSRDDGRRRGSPRCAAVVVDVEATAAQVPAIAAVPAVEWVGIRRRRPAQRERPLGHRHRRARPLRRHGARPAERRRPDGGGRRQRRQLQARPQRPRPRWPSATATPAAPSARRPIYTQDTPAPTPPSSMTIVQNNPAAPTARCRLLRPRRRRARTRPTTRRTARTRRARSRATQASLGAYDGARRPRARRPARLPEHRRRRAAASEDCRPTTTSCSARRTGRATPAAVRERRTTRPTTRTTSRSRTPAPTTTPTASSSRSSTRSGEAIAIDQFVWDHEDMAIVVSAGNAGRAPLARSAAGRRPRTTSPAGVVERAPADGLDRLAGELLVARPDRRRPVRRRPWRRRARSSSRPKGGTVDDYHYLQGTSMSGPVLTGAR